jgi:hypothetical protein
MMKFHLQAHLFVVGVNNPNLATPTQPKNFSYVRVVVHLNAVKGVRRPVLVANGDLVLHVSLLALAAILAMLRWLKRSFWLAK